jgi:hypothetical protein
MLEAEANDRPKVLPRQQILLSTHVLKELCSPGRNVLDVTPEPARKGPEPVRKGQS